MSDVREVTTATGALQGPGKRIVKTSCVRGYGVVATSRLIQPSNGPDLVTVAGNIGDPDTGKRMVAAARKKFGRVDMLLNDAGIYLGGPFMDDTEDRCWLKLLTNLDGRVRQFAFSVNPRDTDKGWSQRGQAQRRNRTCHARHPRECCRSGGHQDADALPRNARVPGRHPSDKSTGRDRGHRLGRALPRGCCFLDW